VGTVTTSVVAIATTLVVETDLQPYPRAAEEMAAANGNTIRNIVEALRIGTVRLLTGSAAALGVIPYPNGKGARANNSGAKVAM
jgi:hypothetical protein